MVKNSNKKLWLIVSVILAVLLIVTLTVGASTAWFGLSKNISGKVELTPGIKVDFGNTIVVENQNDITEFWLKKYDVSNVNELTTETTTSKLKIQDARPSDAFAIVNPSFTSLTTDNFYVRAKIIYKDIVTKQELSQAQQLEAFGMINPIKMGENWLVDESNNWHYLVNSGTTSWQNNVANANELKLVEENDEVSFLLTTNFNNVNYVPLTLAPGQDIEHMSFDGVYIILQLQAVEQNSVNVEFFA